MQHRNNMRKNTVIYVPLIFLLIASSLHAVYDMTSVQGIVTYAAKMPEFLEHQSGNPYDPAFAEFNTLHAVSYLDTLLHRLGLREILDIDDFITTIRQVTQLRELNGRFGSFVEKYYNNDTTHWFICGAFNGALHGQLNVLRYLKNQRIINDELELIQADTYLIFTDTLQAYTPYGLESLWIMLTLLKKNPDKVLLLKTTDWPSDQWQNSSIVNAFYVRFNRPYALIKRLLDDFYNTLPDAIYLISDDAHVVKITAEVSLPDASWNTFFQEKVSGVFPTTDIASSGQLVPLKYLLDIHSITTKASLYQDTFMQLTTQKDFAQWKVMLWQQNKDTRDGFMLARSYGLSSGDLQHSSNIHERIKLLEQQVETAQQEVDQAMIACKENNEIKENHQK